MLCKPLLKTDVAVVTDTDVGAEPGNAHKTGVFCAGRCARLSQNVLGSEAKRFIQHKFALVSD